MHADGSVSMDLINVIVAWAWIFGRGWKLTHYYMSEPVEGQ